MHVFTLCHPSQHHRAKNVAKIIASVWCCFRMSCDAIRTEVLSFYDWASGSFRFGTSHSQFLYCSRDCHGSLWKPHSENNPEFSSEPLCQRSLQNSPKILLRILARMLRSQLRNVAVGQLPADCKLSNSLRSSFYEGVLRGELLWCYTAFVTILWVVQPNMFGFLGTLPQPSLPFSNENSPLKRAF